MTGTILVTGGSGYIAGFLIRQLIGEGWIVRTTIRSLDKAASVRKILAVDDEKLSVFAADLTSDDGWAAAMAGCTHVAHVASPFPPKAPRHDDELIIPARDGALRALRFAKGAGVGRFVMTSSTAAIAYGRARAQDMPYTEADWTDETSADAYAYVKSKTIAERAARDWVRAEGGAMIFCTVNPALVLGPVMSGDYSTSVEVIQKLLSGALPGCPDIGFGMVDVRDVADLHVRALTAPDMAGERFIASGPFLKLIDIAAILKSRLGPQARKVPLRKLPDVLVRLTAIFDPLVRQVTGELGRTRAMDASHARTILNWVPRPAENTIADCAHSLIEQGLVRL
jgi:dihydroflavonol-4-reductase